MKMKASEEAFILSDRKELPVGDAPTGREVSHWGFLDPKRAGLI
jgi:hypothetical protein